MFFKHTFYGDFAGKDSKVEGENIGIKVGIIDMPGDDYQEGQQPLSAMGYLNGRDDLTR